MYRVSTSTLRSSNVAITFILISRVSVSNDYFNTTQFCKQKKLTLLLLDSSALNVNVLIKTGFVKLRIIHNDKQYIYFKILIGSSLLLNICAPVQRKIRSAQNPRGKIKRGKTILSYMNFLLFPYKNTNKKCLCFLLQKTFNISDKRCQFYDGNLLH